MMEFKIFGDTEFIETLIDAEGTVYILATKKFRDHLESLEKRIQELEENLDVE